MGYVIDTEQEGYRSYCSLILGSLEDKSVSNCRAVCGCALTSIAHLRSIPVTIKGGPADNKVKTLPRHKKNPEVGEKKTVYSSQIFLEQEDAISFNDQEEVRSSHHSHVEHSHLICATLDYPHGLGQCDCLLKDN